MFKYEWIVRAPAISVLTFLLLCFTVCVPASAAWEVNLAPQRWTQPEAGLGRSTNASPQGLVLSVAENTPRVPSTTVWTYDAAKQNLDGYNYCLLTYRAEGIGRGADPSRLTPVLSVVGPGKDGAATPYPILDSSKLWLDGREHTVLIRKPLPATADSVKVEVTTDHSSAGVTIKRLAFFEKIPERVGELEIRNGWQVPGFAEKAFKSIPLTTLFNDSIRQAYTRQLNGDGAAYGGELELPSGAVTVDGVPFTVGDGAKNLVHAAEDSSLMAAKIMAFGKEVTRREFLPVARNDAITIPVNAKGSELYLLLQIESPSTFSMGAGLIPFRFPDIESFAVHLNYANGETDLAFPWSPSDAGFTIQRTLGSYAVPVDAGRILKSVTLMNREWNRNVSVAALTLNTSNKQLFAPAWKAPAPVKTPAVVVPPARPAFAKRQGNSVVLGNRYYEVTADFSNGFSLKNLRNLSNPRTAIKLDPASGIELAAAGKTLTGSDFKLSTLAIEGASVVAELAAKDEALPLKVRLRLTATNNEELQTNCTLSYTGADKPVLQFPLLKGLTIGALQDTWYFFPQINNSLSNKKSWYLVNNTGNFCVQFMDTFNPGAGVGVGLMTRNQSDNLYEYGSSKSEAGVSQYIRYHTGQIGLAANEPLKTVTTSIVLHGGDWHQSAKVYTNWLKTWYKPFKAQDKKWWIDSWLIGCLWPSEKVSLQDLAVPPVYDAKTKTYKLDEARAADLKYLGAKPDGYHYFKWVHDDERHLNLWNEMAEPTYQRVGGLENSQKMAENFHQRDQFLSLYYIPDRYGTFTELAKNYDQKDIAARDAAGNYAIYDGYVTGDKDTILACPASAKWLDYMAQNTNKIVRDVNVDAIYLDVFPFWRAGVCYAPDHGHEVPANPNRGSLELLKRMRDIYPGKTAIWTEFQASDVASQYLDGSLSYSGTSTSLLLNPRWDEPRETGDCLRPEIDIFRYVLPRYKQFTLPQGYGLGWTVMKQMLFNGKGHFGGSWRQWDSDVSKLLGEQNRLLRLYADCFNSDQPEHLVPTLRGDIYANKFPAKNRTLWTVFNASGLTIRGDVIAVPHVPNATYRNAADGKPLRYSVRNGTALINMKLDPQSVTCILQTHAKAK